MKFSRQHLAAAPPAAIALYLLTPAAAGTPFGAWPLTPAGALALAIAIGVALLAARQQVTLRIGNAVVVTTLMLIVVRLSLSALVPDTGWLARYYANDAWTGAPEWSSDYRLAGATRIDPELSFEGRSFPVYYLNGPAFDTGDAREVSEPMTVEWHGTFLAAAADTVTVAIAARGTAVVEIDGAPVGSSQINVTQGAHTVRVRYQKPAGVEGALNVTLHRSNGAPLTMFPPENQPNPRPMLATLAVAADWMAAALLTLIAFESFARAWRSPARTKVCAAVFVAAALGLQGYVTALPQTRFLSLTGGDDWLGFESRARDILQHGLLMPLGHAIGEGVPYFYHPFYSYFLAAVHLVTGESLFGPIFVHFLILVATALIAWTMTARLFGELPATVAVAALVVIFEVDFIRYYTITLLSENLYVLTVTCCLAAYARWAETARTRWLVAAGAWGGISSATRPAMLVFFVPAMLVTAAIAHRHGRRFAAAPLIAAASWMVVIMPFTLRNWMVSGQAVLVSSGQGGAVIVHNVPPPLDAQPYFQRFVSGEAGTLTILWQLFLENPIAMVQLHVRKLGFTFGMTQWFDGYRPHPELVAVTALYALTLILSKTMRRPELWPAHAFVASHWASMALTSPWNYGYRLILPPFVYTTTLSVAAAVSMIAPLRSRMRV